jgi:hypothetical protein
MSSLFRPSYLIFAVAAQILHFFTNSPAQDIQATIEIRSENPSIVQVSGRFLDPDRNLSFVRSYAGFNGLGGRISNVVLKTDGGQNVAFQPAVPGEYVANGPFTEWSYAIDLSPRKEQNAAAHISWIGNVIGILTLADVLPIFGKGGKTTSAKVKIVLPDGWRQMENRIDGIVETRDAASEVVVVGKDIRFRMVHTGGTAITICIAGEWLFTGDEVTNFARDIYANTRETFVANASKDVFVNIFKFPENVPHGQWQAATRGRNVTIISSDMPFKTQSLQRLHEQLRHEMFHLWIPNSVNLSGNYDWFYEGFALYASLKMAVAMNRIRFDDFLDTLSRAQAIDARQTNRLSLIDASNRRWNGADTYVYARGMVTAFLCDVLLLHNSKGKRSVNDILREFYTKHKYPNPRTDGNEAALAVLQTHRELSPVIDKYVMNSGKFAWEAELSLAGVEMKNGLSVMSKLNGRQKDLLDALGYNNWRKPSK